MHLLSPSVNLIYFSDFLPKSDITNVLIIICRFIDLSALYIWMLIFIAYINLMWIYMRWKIISAILSLFFLKRKKMCIFGKITQYENLAHNIDKTSYPCTFKNYECLKKMQNIFLNFPLSKTFHYQWLQ